MKYATALLPEGAALSLSLARDTGRSERYAKRSVMSHSLPSSRSATASAAAGVLSTPPAPSRGAAKPPACRRAGPPPRAGRLSPPVGESRSQNARGRARDLHSAGMRRGLVYAQAVVPPRRRSSGFRLGWMFIIRPAQRRVKSPLKMRRKPARTIRPMPSSSQSAFSRSSKPAFSTYSPRMPALFAPLERKGVRPVRDYERELHMLAFCRGPRRR